jgi:hypothetical protein
MPHEINALQEQLVGFINDEIINPTGEFHEIGSSFSLLSTHKKGQSSDPSVHKKS